MTYATVTQLKDVIPARDLEDLTDFDRTGTASDARLTAALADATSEIDSYIAKVVTLPMAEPPRILAVLCRDLAMHRLYLNLGHDMEVYKRLRSDALATLKDIAAGRTAIGGKADGRAELTSPGVAMTDGPERRLTRAKLRGY